MSTVTGCVSISAFASLVAIPVGIISFALVIKISSITPGIKEPKSFIKKKKNKLDKIALLGKVKLNTTKVLISKALILSYISHDKFVLVDDVLREYYKIKEEIKKFKNFCGKCYIKTMETYYVSCKK